MEMDVAQLLDKLAEHRLYELSNFIAMTRDKYDGWFGGEFTADQAADISIASSMVVYAVLILKQHGYDMESIKAQVPKMVDNCADLDPAYSEHHNHKV